MNRHSLTTLAHEAVKESLYPGATAIDATIGNGHDTLFLATESGIMGHVYGFDIQPLAIAQTEARLACCSNCAHVELFLENHNRMALRVPTRLRGTVSAIMFNLGYLPGGDKKIITSPESTLDAIQIAIAYLAEGGTLTIIAYRGHPGGQGEAEVVLDWAKTQDRTQYSAERVEGNSSSGPFLLIIRRRTATGDR